MSNFWNLTDGTTAGTGTEYTASAGFELIPDNTQCLAVIEEAGWKIMGNDEWIALKWRIISPQEFTNRVMFQKVKVYGTETDKAKRNAVADKAKRMLAAIDANAGGNLRDLSAPPDDADLALCLSGKMMGIKVMQWTMTVDGVAKSGNWIGAVAPGKPQANPAQPAQPLIPVAPKARPARAVPQQPRIDDDEIPF